MPARNLGTRIAYSDVEHCPEGDGSHSFGRAILDADGLTETAVDTEHGTGHTIVRPVYVTVPPPEVTERFG